MERDTEILIQRAPALVFCIFGHFDGLDGRRIVRVGGSGMFIAPFQALTARHVCRDLFRTDSNRADDLYRRTSGYLNFRIHRPCFRCATHLAARLVGQYGKWAEAGTQSSQTSASWRFPPK